MTRYYSLPLFLLLLFAVSLSGCLNLRLHKTGSDYSYNGAFNKYKTFSFISDDSFQDSVTKENAKVLKKYIRQRLELQGYEYSERKPDLLVSFFLYYNDLNMKGYDQEQLEVWLVKNNEPLPEDSEHEKYRPVKLYMSEGTLLVTLLDQRKHNAVWQGYASGVLANKDQESTAYLNRAVRSIFDQYRVFRKGYLRSNDSNN